MKMCKDVFIRFITGSIVCRAAIGDKCSVNGVIGGCDIKERPTTILCVRVINRLYIYVNNAGGCHITHWH